MKSSTLIAGTSVISILAAGVAGVWRQLQPIPAPEYREFSGEWRALEPYHTTKGDLTIEAVARQESKRLGREIKVEDIENAILMGWVYPKPAATKTTRYTFRIHPDYSIAWPP